MVSVRRSGLGRPRNDRRANLWRISLEFIGQLALSHGAIDSNCYSHRSVWRLVPHCLDIIVIFVSSGEIAPRSSDALGVARRDFSPNIDRRDPLRFWLAPHAA